MSLARSLLVISDMRSVDTRHSWSSSGIGGKITSESAPPHGAPLAPQSTDPTPLWRSSDWLERVMQRSDYFYLAGVVAVILLSACILIFD